MSNSMQRPGTGAPLVEVIVTEELHAQGAQRLHALLDDALALKPERIVVDLARCPFVDAATVAVLLDAHRRAWVAGGQLTLHRPSPRLYRILQLARVDHVFHITPTPMPAPPSTLVPPVGQADDPDQP